MADKEQQTKARKKFRIRNVLMGLGIAYILFMVFVGADRVILFPTTEPLNAPGAVRRTIPFNDGVLEIWTARSRAAEQREPEAFVLEFTGNATRAEDVAWWAAWRWMDRPVEAWTVNYPGYGGSTGPARLKSIPSCALVAYDELRRTAGTRPIFVSGNSLGTTAALHVAAQRPVAGVLLQNPPPLQNMIIRRFGWWNLWLLAAPVAWQVPTELNSLVNAPNVKVPGVFVLAGQDQTVPPQYQKKVADAYAGQSRQIIVQNAGHNLRHDWSEPTVRGLTAEEWDKVRDDLLRREASERARAMSGD